MSQLGPEPPFLRRLPWKRRLRTLLTLLAVGFIAPFVVACGDEPASEEPMAWAEARLREPNAPSLPSSFPAPPRFQLKDDGGELLGSLPFESLEVDRIAWTPYDRGAVAVVHHGRHGGSSLYHINGAHEDIWLRTEPGQSISLPSLAPNGEDVAYVVEDSPRWLGETNRSGLQFGGSLWVSSPSGRQQVASLEDAAEILGWLDERTVAATRYLPGDLPEQRPFLVDLPTGRVQPIAIQEPHAYAFALVDDHLLYAASEQPIITLPAPSANVSVVAIDLRDGQRDVKSVEQGYLPVSIRRQAGELRYELEATGFERVIDEDTGRVRTEPIEVEERTIPSNPMPFAGLPMPYVHQVYDTPNDFNGHWACGPTSTLMCILHFGRLDKWPINVSTPSAHESPYGAYVAYKYTAFGTTFDRMQTDASGKPAYGAYGWATDGGMGWAWRMQDYAAKHNLKTSFDAAATFTKLKAATDAGRPVALSTNLTSAGHIVTVKGTTSDGKLIVNDPYGNRNAGYMNYSGEDVIYTFVEVKAKWFVTVWSTEPVCTPQPETCNGKDDDCNGEVDEGEVCEREALLRGQSWVSPSRTTDIDGDGQADVCGRGSAGVWCHLSTGTSWGEKGATLPLSDSDGWDDPTNWGTLRMGDVDGDGRADLCGRSDTTVTCWKSDGTSLTTALDGPEWSDESGWDRFQYHSTIRLLDIDGDGRDDLCARAAKGMVCRKSEGDAFGDAVDGPAWSNEAGHDSAKYYGTLRTGDVDGDRKQDLCMRTQDGMECFLSDGEGYRTKVTGPAWSDESGWGAMQYWSTIRLADVNGDGKADLCARAATGLRCHFSEGDTFGETVEVAALADESGWADPSNYLTLRTGDVDGDGAQDLCIRANAKMICYVWKGDAFESFDGPAWADADGWDKPQYFHTIQLGDMNGDGKADLCGRHEAGWRCHPSTGSGFGDAIALDEFTDAGGWATDRYYATIMMGGPACIPTQEVCNGKDDDCDGEIDEDGVCDVGTGGAAGTGGSGAGGTGTSGSSGSAGTPSGMGHSASEPEGCACRTSPGTNASHPGLLACFGFGLGWWLRRRRQ